MEKNIVFFLTLLTVVLANPRFARADTAMFVDSNSIFVPSDEEIFESSGYDCEDGPTIEQQIASFIETNQKTAKKIDELRGDREKYELRLEAIYKEVSGLRDKYEHGSWEHLYSGNIAGILFRLNEVRALETKLILMYAQEDQSKIDREEERKIKAGIKKAMESIAAIKKAIKENVDIGNKPVEAVVKLEEEYETTLIKIKAVNLRIEQLGATLELNSLILDSLLKKKRDCTEGDF